MRPRILVIGVGNEFRRDDGVGLWLARWLARVAPAQVVVREAASAGPELFEWWRAADVVFVLDAVQSGAPPGTRGRWEAGQLPTLLAGFRASTHALGLAEALRLAEVLGRLPARLVVCGLEGARFDPGAGLSPAVARAALALGRDLLCELRGLGERKPKANNVMNSPNPAKRRPRRAANVPA